MKTKTIVILEIAIVLCSVFLVATLPAIAANQNQTMQKAITTASEDDSHPLGIYGNANEDDTIDMRDTTYIKLVIFGKKPKTDLADANYDGKVSMLDVGQTKLIILNKEKELTVIDSADRIVTVKKPIERIVTAQFHGGEALSLLDVKGMVVGVPECIAQRESQITWPLYPELCELPSIGSRMDPDIEEIIMLSPDVVLLQKVPSSSGEDALEKADIPVVVTYFYIPQLVAEEIEMLGYIFDRRDVAKEYIDFFKRCKNKIKDRTEELSEGEKTRVYIEVAENYKAYGKDQWPDVLCTQAGGRNIIAEVGTLMVDPEFVVKQNPEVIVKIVTHAQASCGYAADDSSEIRAFRDALMSRPELANVNAVKDNKVYLHTSFGLARFLVTAVYYAKWFHPELFEDLDPKAIHQEYLDRFFEDANFNLDEHGIFVYPPLT